MLKGVLLIIATLSFTVTMTACGGQSAGTTQTEVSGASETDKTKDFAGLVEALEEAGAKVEQGDAIDQPFFTVSGQIIKVNGADVQAFEYADNAAMETEAANVPADGSSFATIMVTWIDVPHFYKSGRLIALYVGNDKAITDLLEAALGAQFAGR